MEFDADRYEARVAGSNHFESATKQFIGLGELIRF
jgi:hypothetical protein